MNISQLLNDIKNSKGLNITLKKIVYKNEHNFYLSIFFIKTRSNT